MFFPLFFPVFFSCTTGLIRAKNKITQRRITRKKVILSKKTKKQKNEKSKKKHKKWVYFCVIWHQKPLFGQKWLSQSFHLTWKPFLMSNENFLKVIFVQKVVFFSILLHGKRLTFCLFFVFLIFLDKITFFRVIRLSDKKIYDSAK